MLEIIGAGLGRTGTHSLAAALEILGFGPCYHMLAFSAHPEHQATWRAALQGEDVDWQRLFAGYRSTVEWPAVAFLKRILPEFPAAKVVLTTRAAADWYDSAAATIFTGLEKSRHNPDPIRRQQAALAREIILERFFAGQHWDRETTISRYEQHLTTVQHIVPPGRLFASR